MTAATTMKTFNGSKNTYSVIATVGDVEWGVSVSVGSKQVMAVRFATCKITQSPPTHFNYRGTASFSQEGVLVHGVYLDKGYFEIVESPVDWGVFEKLCDDLDLPSIMAEWISRQFKLEGVTLDVSNEDLEALVKASYMGKANTVAVPIFKIPKDIWHEIKVFDKNSPAQKEIGDDESAD